MSNELDYLKFDIGIYWKFLSMDFHELFKRYSPLLKKHLSPILLASAGLIFLVYGLISFLGTSAGSEKIIFEENNPVSEEQSLITIDIEGSVVKPGVYQLGSNARLKDALVKAGGLSSEANRDWVAKNLNLAQKLKDGAKIYIPLKGETISTTSTTGITSSTGMGQGGQININTASEKELDSLPGVGLVTAGKIISGRPYNSIEELLEKKVVSSKVFEQIKEKVTAY